VNEIPILLIELEQGLAAPGDAGGVDQDVDAAHLLHHLRHDVGDCLEVGEIKGHFEGIAAGGAPLLGNLFDPGLVAVEYSHGGAQFEQRSDGRARDTGCAACY
jgi:hypothetical protein